MNRYPNPKKQMAVVFDVDDTLFDISSRKKLAGGNPDSKDFDWDKFYSNDAQSLDVPYPKASDFVRRKAEYYQIIYLTGRLDSMRPGFEESRIKGDFPPGLTIMKEERGRYLNSATFKQMKLEELMLEYDIVEFYDDDEENVAVARKMGIKQSILVHNQDKFWTVGMLYYSCKQAHGHYVKLQRQIEHLKREQARVMRTGRPSNSIYNDILECKNASRKAMLYIELFCNIYRRNPKVPDYMTAFGFPKIGDEVNGFTVVSLVIQHRMISRFQEYVYPTQIIVQGKGDIWKAFGHLDNQTKVVYSEHGNPYKTTTGIFKYKKLKGGWSITSSGRAVRIVDLENPFSKSITENQAKDIDMWQAWYEENGISSENAKGMAYHNVLGISSPVDIVITVPHAEPHLEPGTHLTDWAAEPLAKAIFNGLERRSYARNPFRMSNLGEPIIVAVVGVITRLLADSYLMRKAAHVENPTLLVGDIDRTIIDLNRPHADSTVFYQKIRASVKPKDIVLDIHSFPPEGTKRAKDHWDMYDIVMLGVPDVTDKKLLSCVSKSLRNSGFKVKIGRSAKWNWIQTTSRGLGARPVLIECNEKHLSTGKIPNIADAIINGTMRAMRG